MKHALALLLLACVLPLGAQVGDPLKSPDCAAALAGLNAARAAGAANVDAMRNAAAATCLGSAHVPTRPGRVLQAPMVVPAPQIEVPQRVAPLPPVTLPPPPVEIGRLPAPTTCDAGGCWANDGTHLRHVAPNLIGPAGLCTQVGGVVRCP
ncbi:MAG TPA: hypothetical protein VHL79_07135 [Ramlibacter sp.]|jgi:hypothetical protein|nr:hypothetical protein [Ramlibacter sp.]